MAIVLASVAVTFLLLVSGGMIMLRRIESAGRIARIGTIERDVELIVGAEPAPSRLERLVLPFHRILPRSESETSALTQRLARAGYRDARCVNVFSAVRVAVPAGLCVLVTVTGLFQLSPIFVYTAAAGIGYLLPDLWLGRRISARQEEIRLGLPEALDLLVICVEAGLSLDRAILRTSEELRNTQPAVAEELSLVNLEQRAGCPRADALRHCAERTGVDSIRGLASLLIQADKFGTSVGRALRTHADGLRTRRRQDAEERAAKTTVKLVFPLVLFIFPSLFLVKQGPSMITIFEALQQYLV